MLPMSVWISLYGIPKTRLAIVDFPTPVLPTMRMRKRGHLCRIAATSSTIFSVSLLLASGERGAAGCAGMVS